jgi:dienelactone hydrolase
MVRELAGDVVPAINYAKSLPNVDPTKIVLIGISQGGMTVAGLGAMNIPGVIGIVNFVGGAKQPGCKSGYYPTVQAFSTLGKTRVVPPLLTEFRSRGHAAMGNFCLGGTPPMAVFGLS